MVYRVRRTFDGIFTEKVSDRSGLFQIRFSYNFSSAPITAYSAIAMIHRRTIDMRSQFILKRCAGILIQYDINKRTGNFNERVLKDIGEFLVILC